MSHINPDKRFVVQVEKVDLATLPWLHIYSQPFEHFEATIVGNHRALEILLDAIKRALNMPIDGDSWERTSEEVLATDGEGYDVAIKLLPDNPEKKPLLDNLWDRFPPYYVYKD